MPRARADGAISDRSATSEGTWWSYQAAYERRQRLGADGPAPIGPINNVRGGQIGGHDGGRRSTRTSGDRTIASAVAVAERCDAGGRHRTRWLDHRSMIVLVRSHVVMMMLPRLRSERRPLRYRRIRPLMPTSDAADASHGLRPDAEREKQGEPVEGTRHVED